MPKYTEDKKVTTIKQVIESFLMSDYYIRLCFCYNKRKRITKTWNGGRK